MVNDTIWDDVCNDVEEGDGWWLHHTAFGDGEYYDGSDGIYPVDSGTIGIIADWRLEGCKRGDIDYSLVNKVTFTESFVVDCIDGCFEIGHLIIETNDDVEDDDYESED